MMKEMLGGCCVCSDENGWNDNPLIYCDGPDCEVAVHQGCYGIQEVPEGEWFCAKCQDLPSSSFTSDTNQLNGIRRKPARCELCCFDFGALKKTETGGWAHVICALYIPEVRFGDVHTMDPVIISHVPNDRFDKPCYICVNKGDTAGAASGACMSCNKPGCKRGFHVTCAQQRGLLCEEGGGSKNVKYCGYCDHHLRKAALDPAIKIVPPCRVRAHPTLLHSQPTPPSSNNSAGHMLVDPIPRPEGTVLGHPVHSTEDSHLHSNFSPPLTTSSRSSVALDATPPLVVPSSMNTLKNESHRPPSTNGFNPHTASHAGELTNHNRIERNGHSDEKSNIVESTSTLHQIQSTPVTSSKSGKRPREPKHDGENKKRQRTNRPTKSEKVLLSLVGPVVSETVSDFQRERVADRSAAERRAAAAAAASVPSTSHDINGGGGTLQVFSPTTNDDKSGIRGSSSTTCTLGGPSGSTLPSSMEQLLERQWEQESQLMIAQAHTQFDVSKLLNCLHQLKSENIRLEEQLNHLSRRRDHLIALNTRLAIPLNASFSPSIHQHQQQLIQHHIQHHQQQQQQQGIQSSPHQSPQVATTSSTVTVPSCPPPVPSTVSTQPSTIAATEDSLTQLRSLATGNGTSRVQATPPPTSHCTTAAAVAVQTPSTSYSTATTNSYIQQQHQPTSRSSISSVTSASVPPTIQSPVASQAQTPTVAELAANISPDRLNAMNTLNLLGRQQLLGSNMELASFVLANQGFNNNLNLLARFMRHQ